MNEIQLALKLTKSELEALEHRLDIPECIVEAFEGYPEENPLDEETLKTVTDLLSRGKLIEATMVCDRTTKEVLVDAVEGSTWFATHKDNVSERKLNAVVRTLESLAVKVSAYTDLPCEVPLY